MRSRIPTRGFNQVISIVRKLEGDDGFGGISLSTTVTVYVSRRCRITTMSDKDEREGYGEASGRHWEVALEYSSGIQRSDYIVVPWGTYPNDSTAAGLTGNFPPKAIINTPAGSKTLIWFAPDSKYSDADASNDPANNYTLFWTGSNWRFVDSVAGTTYNFSTDYEQHHNVLNLAWNTLISSSYSVTSQTGSSKEYRVVYFRHIKDDHDAYHHTALTMELGDIDDEDE